MAEGLLDKANIILTPTGYKAGTMYNVAPIEQPYEDFDFARASVASRVNSSGLVEMVGRTLGSNLVQNGDFSEIGTDLVQNGDFSQLGSEQIINGDFSDGENNWLFQTGWSVVDGKATVENQTGWLVTEGTPIPSNASIKLQFDVVLTAGVLRFKNNTNDFSDTISTVGSYTVTRYYTTGASTSNLQFPNYPTAFSGSIDNVSVKQVDPNDYWSTTSTVTVKDGFANITSDGSYQYLRQLNIVEVGKSYKLTYEITRQGSGVLKSSSLGLNSIPSTVGTHIVYGLSSQTYIVIDRASACDIDITNIVVQELDPNDYWTLGAGWSLGDDKATSIGSNFGQQLKQTILQTNKIYKLSFDIVDYTSGNIALESVYYGVLQTFNGIGSYVTYFTSLSQTELRLYSQNFIGSVTNIVVQEVIDTNNIPRINYDSNGENGHWLLEPTSTNLIPYSEDFTTWTVNAATTVYPNTTETLSPSGEYNASKITSDGSNGLYKAVAFGGGDNTKSIYLKGIVGGEQVILRDPAQTINQKTLTLTTDWVRYELSENQTSTIGLWINEIPSNGIYMWGGQLEALSYSTSYIPTLTGSTETRATETANGAGSADLINSTEGVLYAEIAALANDGTNRTIALNKDTNDRIQMYFNTSTNGLSIFYKAQSGATAFIINETLTDATSFNKIAFKWKTNDFALWVNGVETDTVSSGVTPTANSLNALEFEMFNNASPFYGKCKELTVFGEALSDDELEKLTSWSSFNAMATDLGYTIE